MQKVREMFFLIIIVGYLIFAAILIAVARAVTR